MSKKPVIESPITLTVDQIGTEQTPVGRRSAMKVLGAAVLGAGATGVAASLTGCIVRTAPQPQYTSGLTDSDGGQYADPGGNGRGQARGMQTGLTDSDGGSYADAAGYGRGRHGQQGYSSGQTDSDGGAYADPAGNGRGTARLGNTGLTDSDGGRWADAAGHGRGRYR
jgi:hypothetical protein